MLIRRRGWEDQPCTNKQKGRRVRIVFLYFLIAEILSGHGKCGSFGLRVSDDYIYTHPTHFSFRRLDEWSKYLTRASLDRYRTNKLLASDANYYLEVWLHYSHQTME